jgi:hypothetical protein
MRKAGHTTALAVLALAIAGLVIAAAAATKPAASATANTPSGCLLGDHGQVKHVIYLQFDNTHYRRDNPNVPSDLEQMPHLLNFLKSNGSLLTNDHTILISHTAGGILSSLTGLYPDRNGQAVSNSFGFFNSSATPSFQSSFKYWTDTVDGSDDSLPNMVGDGGQTAPAPWLTYTHAGCNVGGVSAANIELENANTSPTGDITRVFGNPSPELTEAGANPTKALADFVGIAVHCALGNALCNSPHARPDDATIVPGSNNGYLGLFGAAYVNPAITGGQPCVNDTSGQPIKDGSGNCGFPGFDGALAKNTLGEVAQMQENGVPVTFAYISDAHDNHSLGRASGPGEADYKQQLADYDAAFASFFTRLQKDGITKSNTLFVVTVDEGDHFAGGTGTPQSDGSLAYSHTPCSTLSSCPSNQIGEVTARLGALLPAGEPTFAVHSDDAPTFYVNGQPTRTDPALRKLERDVSTATAPDPYKGGAPTPITVKLADSVEEKTLHMVTSDPKRTPSFTLFGNDDFFFQTGAPSCGADVCVSPTFAWNHGDEQDEIGNTWLGMVGPGVAQRGTVDSVWTDHTDLRPTMLSLLGLSDSYEDDGRVITEILGNGSHAIRDDNNVTQLGDIYKQLNAPFGSFGQDTLTASTKALGSSDDLKYDSIETQIANLTFARDNLAGTIRSALNGAEFGNDNLNGSQVHDWIDEAQHLIDEAHALAAAP